MRSRRPRRRGRVAVRGVEDRGPSPSRSRRSSRVTSTSATKRCSSSASTRSSTLRCAVSRASPPRTASALQALQLAPQANRATHRQAPPETGARRRRAGAQRACSRSQQPRIDHLWLTEPGAAVMAASTAQRLGLRVDQPFKLRVGGAVRNGKLIGTIGDVELRPRHAAARGHRAGPGVARTRSVACRASTCACPPAQRATQR